MYERALTDEKICKKTSELLLRSLPSMLHSSQRHWVGSRLNFSSKGTQHSCQPLPSAADKICTKCCSWGIGAPENGIRVTAVRTEIRGNSQFSLVLPHCEIQKIHECVEPQKPWGSNSTTKGYVKLEWISTPDQGGRMRT